MYSSIRMIQTLSFILGIITFPKDVQAASQKVFTATPNKCVALREGKQCYADIKISWHVNKVGDYCLRKAQQKAFIACWKQVNFGQHAIKFTETHSTQFELIDMLTRRKVHNLEVQVNWVYKNKQKKRRWRIF